MSRKAMLPSCLLALVVPGSARVVFNLSVAMVACVCLLWALISAALERIRSKAGTRDAH